MKLKEEFIVHKTESETVLVPVGGAAFAGIVKGNATLGNILELLREDTTAEAVKAAMLEKYEAPADAVSRDVEKVLSELRGIGALDE